MKEKIDMLAVQEGDLLAQCIGGVLVLIMAVLAVLNMTGTRVLLLMKDVGVQIIGVAVQTTAEQELGVRAMTDTGGKSTWLLNVQYPLIVYVLL